MRSAASTRKVSASDGTCGTLTSAALEVNGGIPHHRRAEVAAARAPHDLADVETDANAQALAVDRPHGGLLHGDRAVHRIRRRCEGRHLPVAQPLELLTAARRQRVRQRAVVALEDALRALVTQPLHEDCRIDDVREEDRRDRSACDIGHGLRCNSRARGGSNSAPRARGRGTLLHRRTSATLPAGRLRRRRSARLLAARALPTSASDRPVSRASWPAVGRYLAAQRAAAE